MNLSPKMVAEGTTLTYTLIQAADPSLPMNGNNGNYDLYQVSVDGLDLALVPDCDWTRLASDFCIDLNETVFEIKNGLVWQDDAYLTVDGNFMPLMLD